MRAALAAKLLQREGDTRRILLEEGAGVSEALKAIQRNAIVHSTPPKPAGTQ